MTTISATAAQEKEERTGYELFDADGHVLEDVQGIMAKMPSKWGEAMRGRFENPMSKLHGMTILPWLGYLSTIPTGGSGTAISRKGPMEHGENPESWEYFLEAVGIERTVLYPTLGLTIGRVRDLEYVKVVTRAWNDWIWETYIQHPSGRFQAAALLPMQVPSAAVEELKRVKELGFAAATIPANGLPNHLGSPMFFPVYEAAQELNIGLACHGGVHDGFGFDDFNVFAPVHALGFPFGLLRALGGMLFNRVFEEFPGLRVAFLEGGAAWLLMAAERFSESYGSTRPMASQPGVLHLPDGMRVKDYISQLMQAGRIVDGIEGGEDQLARAIEYFGSTSFMYSSDFPHEVNIESCKHELEELNELPISDEAKRMLRGGAARDVL